MQPIYWVVIISKSCNGKRLEKLPGCFEKSINVNYWRIEAIIANTVCKATQNFCGVGIMG